MQDIYIRIKPRDPLFFRTAKPFDAGEVSWTESSFMPSPSVIWGSIYTMLIREGVVSLPSQAGDVDSKQLKLVQLKQIRLKESSYCYQVAPLDLYFDKDKWCKTLCLSTIEEEGFVTAKKRKYILRPDDPDLLDEVISQNDWIRFNGMGYSEDGAEFHSESYKLYEKKYSAKVGIKRQAKTKLVEDGQLYRLQQTAFNDDTSIIIHLQLAEGLDFPPEGVLKLGGEGRIADFKLAEEEKSEFKLNEITDKSHKVRLYFHSAFGCDTSSHLDLVDCLEAQLAKKEIKLLAICSGRSEGFSGFDLAKNRPKPLVRCFPAGTVIYLEFKEELDCLEWRDKMNSFLEESPLESYKGYNQFIVCEPVTL